MRFTCDPEDTVGIDIVDLTVGAPTANRYNEHIDLHIATRVIDSQVVNHVRKIVQYRALDQTNVVKIQLCTKRHMYKYSTCKISI